MELLYDRNNVITRDHQDNPNDNNGMFFVIIGLHATRDELDYNVSVRPTCQSSSGLMKIYVCFGVFIGLWECCLNEELHVTSIILQF